MLRRWRHLFVWVGVGIIVVEHRRDHGQRAAAAAALRGRDHRALGGVLDALAADDRAERLPGEHGLLARPGRPLPDDRQVGDRAACSSSPRLSRLYLAQDHPTGHRGRGRSSASPSRWPPSGCSRPTTSTPCATRRGRPAHLDVTGARGDAIVRALQDQLGLIAGEVEALRPGRLGRLDAAEDHRQGRPGHLRVRQALRGHARALRPLVQARAHAALRPAGGRAAVPQRPPAGPVRGLRAARALRRRPARGRIRLGIVEITPEREYLLVTEFFDGAVEIGEADVDDEVIDQGLSVVRRMWEIGLAHRDIKPANLLVRDGMLFVIDTAFAEVRPSPWRQAVDLANMMLVLGLRTSAEQVYARATTAVLRRGDRRGLRRHPRADHAVPAAPDAAPAGHATCTATSSGCCPTDCRRSGSSAGPGGASCSPWPPSIGCVLGAVADHRSTSSGRRCEGRPVALLVAAARRRRASPGAPATPPPRRRCPPARRRRRGRDQRRRPDGPVGAHGHRGCRACGCSRRWAGASTTSTPGTTSPTFWLDSDRDGDAGHRGAAGGVLRHGRGDGDPQRPRRACAGSSGSSQTTPHYVGKRYYVFDGGCITFVFRLSGETAAGSRWPSPRQGVGVISRDDLRGPGGRRQRRPARPGPAVGSRVTHDRRRDRRSRHTHGQRPLWRRLLGPLLSVALLAAVFVWFLPQFTSHRRRLDVGAVHDLDRGHDPAAGGRLEPGHLPVRGGRHDARADVPAGHRVDRDDDGRLEHGARRRGDRAGPHLRDELLVGLLPVAHVGVAAGVGPVQQLRQARAAGARPGAAGVPVAAQRRTGDRRRSPGWPAWSSPSSLLWLLLRSRESAARLGTAPAAGRVGAAAARSAGRRCTAGTWRRRSSATGRRCCCTPAGTGSPWRPLVSHLSLFLVLLLALRFVGVDSRPGQPGSRRWRSSPSPGCSPRSRSPPAGSAWSSSRSSPGCPRPAATARDGRRGRADLPGADLRAADPDRAWSPTSSGSATARGGANPTPHRGPSWCRSRPDSRPPTGEKAPASTPEEGPSGRWDQ